MKRFWLALALLAFAAAGVLLYRPARDMGSPVVASRAKYQCAMHPQIVSDEPGICPICQMKLQRVHEERKPLFYRHPMRPDVTSPTPAKDEMGMDYVAVYPEDVSPGGAGDVPGHAPFTLSSERQQLIGVTTGRIERRDLVRVLRTVGKVAYDPELYQAIVEYREALTARSEIKESRWHEAQRGADALVRAAALRLRQRGLADDQIQALPRASGDPLNLLLPGKTVWVYAQVYEYEVELIRPGQPVEITAPSMPGKSYAGKVVGIDPILSPATRTARVRVLVVTPDERLRPEAFVTARIEVPLGRTLALPEGAVLDTGEHQIVFVRRDEGRFEPRAVRLGREAQGYHEVLAGVAEGEEVVTSANFLIDSESRFRAALAAFSRQPVAEP